MTSNLNISLGALRFEGNKINCFRPDQCFELITWFEIKKRIEMEKITSCYKRKLDT